jgi:3-hydroxymyristoyl/3-hydroxydecanoyl-(acyl carrier protein) dehydratase
MIEVAAQLISYATHRLQPEESRFFGFAAVDGVKFRAAVEPPGRFVVVAHSISVKPRRAKGKMQGFLDDAMVFEAEITGMPI